jgi:hypothetical protein
MKKGIVYGLFAISTLCAAAGTARADLVFYSNRGAFNAATMGTTTIDFEGIVPDAGFVMVPDAGLKLSGVTFSTDPKKGTAPLFVIGKDFFAPPSAPSAYLDSGQSTAGQNFMMITLPKGTTAFGLDYNAFGFSDPASTLTFSLSTGDTFTRVATPGKSVPSFLFEFVGVTSTVPIASIQITQSITDPGGFNIDNFAFGNAILISIPEPATLTLLSLGALGAIGYGWRNGKRK